MHFLHEEETNHDEWIDSLRVASHSDRAKYGNSSAVFAAESLKSLTWDCAQTAATRESAQAFTGQLSTVQASLS